MILNSTNYAIQPFLDTHEVKGMREEHLSYVLDQYVNEPQGMMLEFGVWKANTINRIASKFPDKEIHGFDSFEGLPEKWFINKREVKSDRPRHNTSTFSTGGHLPPVKENVKLHKGYFENSLPVWIENQGDFNISFLHVDSDLYSSAKYVLTALNNHIIIDTIIIFDDFYRWDRPEVYELWEDGEYKALKEWLEETGREVEILCRSEIGWQTAVRVIK